MEEKENTAAETAEKLPMTAEEVARDYVCSKVCRLCPYPGLKCTPDHDTFMRIQ